MTDKTSGGKPPPDAPQRGRKIRKAGRPLTADPITAADVKNAFYRARVPLPDAAQVERLADLFSFRKVFFLEAERDREINTHARAAGDAIRKLTASLPVLLAHHRKLANAGDPFAGFHADAIEKLLRPVLDADLSRIEWESNVPNVIKDWRWLIGVILTEIEPAFPAGTGIAEGGPISRFLAEILPMVTGDILSAGSIATHLKQMKRNKRELSTGNK